MKHARERAKTWLETGFENKRPLCACDPDVAARSEVEKKKPLLFSRFSPFSRPRRGEPPKKAPQRTDSSLDWSKWLAKVFQDSGVLCFAWNEAGKVAWRPEKHVRLDAGSCLFVYRLLEPEPAAPPLVPLGESSSSLILSSSDMRGEARPR